MSDSSPCPPAPADPSQTEEEVPKLRFRAALERIKPEAMLVEPARLATINLDIPAAVIMAIRAARAITVHRDEVLRHLPTFPVARFDLLETYALAAGQAHAQFVLATGELNAIPELHTKLGEMRELLLADLHALAKRGLIDVSKLDSLKSPVGFKNLAFDVMSIAALLRDHWSTIEGKTGLSLAELDAAEALAERLATALALRDEGGATAASDLRSRTFTLFVEAYGEVRRAFTYLRWYAGDLEKIVPSLYQGRGGRGKKDEENVELDPPIVVVKPDVEPAPLGGVTDGTKPGPGMPGNDPFANG